MESVPAEEESQVEKEAEQEHSGHGHSHSTHRDKDKKERARERREKRRQEISLLRTIPYSDHQKYHAYLFIYLPPWSVLSFVYILR